jgi:glycosyltransferase involved in cell wall biosynthesis
MDAQSTCLRILFNTPNPALRGGPPKHLPALRNALADRAEIVPFEYGRKSDDESRVEKLFGRMADLRRTRCLCRKQRPGLIHHNSAFDSAAILRDAPLVLMAHREGIPIFLKVHGSHATALRNDLGWIKLARDIVLCKADGIGVLSRAEKDEFEEAFPCVRGKMYVVKNVIRPEFFAAERHEAAEPTVVFLSRFLKEKGPFDLLRTAPLVLAEEPTIQFIFAGDGEAAQAFDHEVRVMNLAGSVRRLPHVSEPESIALYSAAWAFVFPTYFPEGMPMVVAEAMTVGAPIISTPTRFARSYMQEEVHVLYSAPGDIEGVAANILQLCRDRQLRFRMSTANRALAREQFRTDSVAQEYVDIYQELTSRAKKGRPVKEIPYEQKRFGITQNR